MSSEFEIASSLVGGMATRPFLILLCAPALAAYTTCTFRRRCSPPIAAESVDAEEAAERTLIDIRQPAEFRLDGRIDGSVNIAAYSWEHGFHLAVPGFEDEVAEAYEKDAAIVLVHSFPALADGAAAVLEGAGFTNVATVDGGLAAWDPDELIVDDDEGLVGAWV